MRFPHYLRVNERDEIPSQFICVDTETHPERLPDGSERDHLTFGWAVYQRARIRGHWCEPEWFRFTDRATFWKWARSKARSKTTLYMFCHNTSFDLPVLGAFTVTRKLGYKLRMAIIDAPPTILKWEYRKATIKFLDTLNFWKVPLAKLGEKIGLPKLPMPSADAPREEWDTYTRQDVEILRRALLGWWEFLASEHLGNFRPTLASQAMGTFKHKYMDTKILVHTRPEVLVLERAAYHGGRCECFYIGRKRRKFTLLDVNSMYPAVMARFPYPVKLLWVHAQGSEDKLRRALRTHLVLADVTLETSEPAFPKVWKNKLMFPVGRFRAVLTTEEVKYALKRRCIREYHTLVEYSGARCFHAFVRDFHRRRLAAQAAGNKTLDYQFKILLNSFYGKFGQTGRVWSKHAETQDESARSWTEVNLRTGKVKKFRQLAGLVQSFEQEPESAESCPVIAAHVTANARMLLWEYICRAGQDHVFYCDTDSLLVDSEGRRNLTKYLHPTRLGFLKSEGEFQDIEIWGAKDYRFGSKVRHKGIRGNAEQISSNQWKQWQWSSLIGLIRSGQLENPYRKPVTKTLRRVYDKGVLERTNRVTPLRIDEVAES